jgi:hypothetical protein
MASRDHSDVSLEAGPVAGRTKTKKVESIGEDRKRKKTMERQKTEIKPIGSEEKRQVCFSKRKHGLFKKAADLSVLCGAHVAAVAFSPGGKPFSFGHPSVEALVDRFTSPSSSAPAMCSAPVHPALLEEFSREEGLLAKALETEASRKKALDAAIVQAGDTDLKGASAQDVLAVRSALERVQAEVAERLQEIMAKEAVLQCTTATDDVVSGAFHYPACAGTFMADGGVSSHHHDQEVMGTQMMVTMGGNVDHALSFAPAMLPPYNHCFDLSHDPVRRTMACGLFEQ